MKLTALLLIIGLLVILPTPGNAGPGDGSHWVQGTEVDEGPPTGPPPTPPGLVISEEDRLKIKMQAKRPEIERFKDYKEEKKERWSIVLTAAETAGASKQLQPLSTDMDCPLIALPDDTVIPDLDPESRDDLFPADARTGIVLLPATANPGEVESIGKLLRDRHFHGMVRPPVADVLRDLCPQITNSTDLALIRLPGWTVLNTKASIQLGLLDWVHRRRQNWCLDFAVPPTAIYLTDFNLLELGTVGMPTQQIGEAGELLQQVGRFPQADEVLPATALPTGYQHGDTDEPDLLAVRQWSWPEPWQKNRWFSGYPAADSRTSEIRLLFAYLSQAWQVSAPLLEQWQPLPAKLLRVGLPAIQAREDSVLAQSRGVAFAVTAPESTSDWRRIRTVLRNLRTHLVSVLPGSGWSAGKFQEMEQPASLYTDRPARHLAWFDLVHGDKPGDFRVIRLYCQRPLPLSVEED